jgi:hypothetical protein
MKSTSAGSSITGRNPGMVIIVVTSTRGGGAAGRFQRFAVLAPGFADEDAHVDEARQDGGAAAIDDLRTLRAPC